MYVYIYNVCVSVCVFMCTLFLIQIYLHISARYFRNLEENVSWFYSTKWTRNTPKRQKQRDHLDCSNHLFLKKISFFKKKFIKFFFFSPELGAHLN